MSLTIALVAGSNDVWGRYRVGTFDITLDTSYPTNGYAVTAALFAQGTQLLGMMFIGGVKAAAEIIPIFDTANSKIACFFPSGGASAATSLTAPTGAAPGIGTLAITGAPTAGTLSATTPAGATPVTSTSATPAMTIAGAPAAGTLAVSGAPTAGAITGGIGIEVGNTSNLSTLTLRAVVVTLG